MLSNGNKITALQINDAEKTINEIIKKKIVTFNIGRLRIAYKNARENLNIEVLSDQQKAKIRNSLLIDDVSEEFRKKTYNELKIEFENYKHIRNNINNINDLCFDSVDIEKSNLIDPQKFNIVVKNSINNNKLFINIYNKLKLKIYGNVITNTTENKQKLLSIANKIDNLYTVPTAMDDIEIIAEYGYSTNIDHALNLSTIIAQQNYPVFNYIQNQRGLNAISGNTSTSKVTNKFLSYLFSDEITNNKTTLFKNTLNNNVNYERVYRLRTLGELLLMISNPKSKFHSKEDREQLYTNNDGTRPKETEYRNWNGLQIYDLDLKDWISDENGDINNLKMLLHQHLMNYHWYLWIVTSSSGNGLHIYTKVAPPHHQYTSPLDNELTSKYWFNVNYMTKLNHVYNIIDIVNKKHNIFKCKYIDNPFVDNVVSRVTAGIRLSYDQNPLVNNKFVDMSLVWGLGQNMSNLNDEKLHKYLDFKFRPTMPGDKKNKETIKLYNKKVKLINDLFLEITSDSSTELGAAFKAGIDPNKISISKLPSHVKIANDLSVIKTLDKNRINYFTRYNVCNTLASIMGVSGLSLAHEILKSDELQNVNEINGFYTCALSNGKTPSKMGLEILKKIGIIKSVSDELKTEIQEGFKNDLRLEMLKVLDNESPYYNYNLEPNEYLDNHRQTLLKQINGNKINIIFSPPGTGKTTLLKELAKSGKRVLLVLPYISVIKNKIEKDESITKDFDVFYGSINIKDIEYGRNAVTTFDKFSKINPEKVARMFDYVYIDESHLLFTSGYRIEATSNVIKKIKDLYYISSNDSTAAQIVLMTGTETGETHFFKDVAQIIKVNKPNPNKNMEFTLCDDGLDAITRLAHSSAKLIEGGYRLLIPTNKGEIYSEKIIGMIQYILKREVKCGYYKRSNTEQEICKFIDEDNTVGDYEIVFCSNYLSVGVDINDNHNFASLYFGDFSGYEIEQFNARIRSGSIESKFFIITEKENGEIYNSLITEPNLILKVTDSDKIHFIDDKKIASAKQEFIAEYDPILRKIVTPGFSLLNGKIQFNLEEYELISFENKFEDAMTHPVKVARELSKYGYNISISTEFDGLDLALQNILKQTGIESAKAEKIRKHSLIVNSFIQLIEGNKYVNKYGLEYNNTIEWIIKNSDKVIEDRGADKHVNIIFDAFASPQEVVVKSRESVDKIISYAKYLISRFSVTKCLLIFNKYVDASGVLKFKNFKRSINLLKLIDNSADNSLSQPLTKTIEKVYDFVDQFENDSTHYVSYNTYQSTLDTWTNLYIDDLGIKINTKRGYDKIKDSILELVLDISTKSSGKNGIRFSYRKLPDQDSEKVLNRRSIDTLINNVFKITEHVQTSTTIIDKHVVLQDQAF